MPRKLKTKKQAMKQSGVKKKDSRSIVTPRKDWAILFAATVALSIISVILHVLIFLRISEGDLTSRQLIEQGSRVTLDEQSLDELTHLFDEKERLFNTFLERGVPFEDEAAEPPSETVDLD